jgi:hypothetical protein
MIKKIFIVLLIFLVFYCIYKPLVIQLQSNESVGNLDLKAGSVFKLKDFIKADKIEKYKVYLVLNNEELEDLNIDIPKWNVLKCEDEKVIFDLFNSEMSYTGADVSTIQSKIYIYSENKLIFESEISLDQKSIGLQNRDFGWVKPVHDKDFISIFSQFKRYNLPILIIW